MSITMPTAFSQNHLKTGAVNTMIAFFRDASGNAEHIASTMDIQQSSLFIHSHLLSVSSINEKLDLHTKSWGTSDVTIKLLNPRYVQGSAGEKDRLSEATDPEWTGTILDWALVDIYLFSGSTNVVFTTDGILRFSGRIIQTPTVTEKTITVKAISSEKEKHKILPTGLIGTTYTDAPIENLEKRKPLVYGEFNQNFWGDIAWGDGSFTGLGLAKAYRIEITKEPKFVASDHILNDVTDSKIFFNYGPQLLFQALTSTASANDSGDGTFTAQNTVNNQGVGDFDGLTAFQRYRLTATVPSYLSSSAFTNPDNIGDNNTGTKSLITDTVSTYIGLGLIGLDNGDIARDVALNLSRGSHTPFFYLFYYDLESIGGVIYDSIKLRLYYADNTSAYIESGEVSDFMDQALYCSDLKAYIGPRADMTLDSSWEGEELAIGFWIDVDPGGSHANLAYIYRAYCETRLNTEYADLEAWVECEGREYGSWITASGRSIDSQSSGDLIENQAHIIESILRDELGVATSQIDTDSFDNAYEVGTAEANRQARLNVFDPKSSEKIIKDLVQQSTFAFTWTAAGKARLVPLHSSYWSSKSVDATISWSHIKPDSLKISKTKIYCNGVEVKSRFHAESTTYRDTDTTTDSGSQTAYGAWRRIARWPSIVGATQVHVSAKYVNSSDGLWSRPHLQIQCETLVFTYAHLEIGDAIELDSVSCDPQLKAYDESWSGIKLCVVGLQQSLSGTKITAVELF